MKKISNVVVLIAMIIGYTSITGCQEKEEDMMPVVSTISVIQTADYDSTRFVFSISPDVQTDAEITIFDAENNLIGGTSGKVRDQSVVALPYSDKPARWEVLVAKKEFTGKWNIILPKVSVKQTADVSGTEFVVTIDQPITLNATFQLLSEGLVIGGTTKPVKNGDVVVLPHNGVPKKWKVQIPKLADLEGNWVLSLPNVLDCFQWSVKEDASTAGVIWGELKMITPPTVYTVLDISTVVVPEYFQISAGFLNNDHEIVWYQFYKRGINTSGQLGNGNGIEVTRNIEVAYKEGANGWVNPLVSPFNPTFTVGRDYKFPFEVSGKIRISGLGDYDVSNDTVVNFTFQPYEVIGFNWNVDIASRTFNWTEPSGTTVKSITVEIKNQADQLLYSGPATNGMALKTSAGTAISQIPIKVKITDVKFQKDFLFQNGLPSGVPNERQYSLK